MPDIVFSFGPEWTGTVQSLVDEFNRQNTSGINVTYREMPADTGEYLKELQQMFARGGSDIDVIGGDVIWPIQFAAQGWIQDLSDDFPESEQQKFLPAPISANTYEGKIYGIPWFTDAGMLYYRKDLLEQAGYSAPPETWDELKEMALKTTQDTGTKNGFVFQGSNYEGGVCNGCEYIWTHGGEVLSEVTSGEVVIDSPEALAGLETYASMVADGVAPQAVANYDETTSGPVFGGGDAVFTRDWPGFYGLLGIPAKDGGYPNVKPEQVGIAPIPTAEPGMQSYSVLGGWNQLINAASAHQNEAWQFIEFMTARAQQRRLAIDASWLPSREELYLDEQLLNQAPILGLSREALNSAKSRPVTEFYGDMSLEMAEQFNLCLMGQVSPTEAAETLQTSLSNIV
jgi:multiple sugar transport system substrate-binding protein